MNTDRLRLEDTVTLPEINLKVAVMTQMIYPDDPEKQAYETMVFSMQTDKAITRIIRQYQTEADARKGHNQIVARLQMGMYKAISIKWQLEFVQEESMLGSNNRMLESNKEC